MENIINNKNFLNLLSNCDEKKAFFTYFGNIKNLNELKKELSERGDHFYFSYVNEKENHFSNWIEHVFQDNVLANDLKKAKNSKEAIEFIEKRLKYAELWLNYNMEKEQISELGLSFYSNFFKKNFNQSEKENLEYKRQNIFYKLDDFNKIDLSEFFSNDIKANKNFIFNQNFSNQIDVLKNFKNNNLEQSNITDIIDNSGITNKKLIPPIPLPFDINNQFNNKENNTNENNNSFNNFLTNSLDEKVIVKQLKKNEKVENDSFVKDNTNQNLRVMENTNSNFFTKFLKFLR